MRCCRFSFFGKRRVAKGVTLIETAVAGAIMLVPISAILVFLIGGQRDWLSSYKLSSRQIEIDGHGAAAIFDRIGRKSDYNDCEISQITEMNRDVVKGKMVEFRYWDNKRVRTGRGRGQSNQGFGASPTNYAQFYLEHKDKKLMVAYGSYRQRASRSVSIADNVTAVEFSRLRFNKIGHGSVRMNLTLTDPDDGKVMTIMAATLMRN